jgi:hypothetical protein
MELPLSGHPDGLVVGEIQQELEAAATFLFRWLVPNLPANVDQVVVPHSSARGQREISLVLYANDCCSEV